MIRCPQDKNTYRSNHIILEDTYNFFVPLCKKYNEHDYRHSVGGCHKKYYSYNIKCMNPYTDFHSTYSEECDDNKCYVRFGVIGYLMQDEKITYQNKKVNEIYSMFKTYFDEQCLNFVEPIKDNIVEEAKKGLNIFKLHNYYHVVDGKFVNVKVNDNNYYRSYNAIYLIWYLKRLPYFKNFVIQVEYDVVIFSW